MRPIRLVALLAALTSITRAARRLPPVVSPNSSLRRPDCGRLSEKFGNAAISIVVPARNEAARIGPLLAAVVAAPGVGEVIVVDDESTDGTADVAAAGGATVLAGEPLPAGWAGKAWALQQGLDAAKGEWVVFLDADTRPSPDLPGSLVARMVADDLDVLTVGGRFDCPTAGLRWLHPALLTTLVYRAAPPGSADPGPVHRRMGNGQCVAARRGVLAGAGGWRPVAHHSVEDLALVRAMATAGFSVAFLDAADLLTARMYESAAEAWSGWGRSLSLPGVEPLLRRFAGLGIVTLAQAAPLLRLLTRRGDMLDVTLLAVRLGVLAGTARAYDRRDVAYWLSPTADLAAVAAIARSLLMPTHRWRGRSYSATPSRSAHR